MTKAEKNSSETASSADQEEMDKGKKGKLKLTLSKTFSVREIEKPHGGYSAAKKHVEVSTFYFNVPDTFFKRFFWHSTSFSLPV